MVPEIVVDDVPVATAFVAFPADEALIFEKRDRLGDGRRADLEAPAEFGGREAAVSVSNDMTEGIIARFRTMVIHRPSVIVGHVLGSVLQSVMSVVLVGTVAVAIGFRSTNATALEWLAARATTRCR